MTIRRRPPAPPRGQRFQWITLGVLVVVGTLVAVMQFSGTTPAIAQAEVAAVGGASSPRTAASQDAAGTPSATRVDLSVTWPVRIERDVFAWQHDVAPAIVQVAAGPDRQAIEREARQQIRLQAIMLDGQPRILANGRLLRTGDQLQGFTLTHIHHRQITLEKQGVAITMSL